MTLTSEKKEIIICALVQLLMKNKNEEKIIKEIIEDVENEIEEI